MIKPILYTRISQEVDKWLRTKADKDRRSISECAYIILEDAMLAEKKRK